MNAGEKISYEASETAISFSAGEIEIDLAARQRDITVFIDIFWKADGELQEESGDAYAANIIIPPWVEREVDTGEPMMKGGRFTPKSATHSIWIT